MVYIGIANTTCVVVALIMLGFSIADREPGWAAFWTADAIFNATLATLIFYSVSSGAA